MQVLDLVGGERVCRGCVLLSPTTRYCHVKNACRSRRGRGGGRRWREHDRMITVITTHNKVTRTLFTLAGGHNADDGTITVGNWEEL